MSDLALAFDAVAGSFGPALADGALLLDQGMHTAIAVSLFTDARARDGDPLPEAGVDRRGWWGDCDLRVDGDETGSRLWLLERSKILPTTLTRAREYAMESLAWLVEDRIASAVDVEVATIAPDVLAIGVLVTRPAGPDRQRYDFVWEASA